MKWGAYWRLMRFNKPAGLLLLWYPTVWALYSSNQGWPPLSLVIFFLIGTISMRAAGCVVNDIADRNVDKHVARTKLRPLTTGELGLFSASVLLVILLSVSFWALINLPSQCLNIAVIALIITAIYPFCKRFLHAPQCILGLAFSIGIPMAYVASNKSFDLPFYILFMINFLWIISYDTIYALADKEDDLRIGVQSTAILFADHDKSIVGLLQIFTQCLWLYWAYLVSLHNFFYFFWFLAGLVCVYQQKLINKRESVKCSKAFDASIYYGALMSIAIGFGFAGNLI
ncbi:MAG: 4-hydroxybenzoate octaprenyltransferase [Legionella sp.]|nr:4-hydroxybenzoate octaprenyltransferase [Legionella sp.]